MPQEVLLKWYYKPLMLTGLSNPSNGPLVVVLAGNSQMGAYALATARQLSNHNVRVKVCLFEPAEKLIQSVVKQLQIYSSTIGPVLSNRSELQEIKEYKDLIIDGLLDASGWDNISADLFHLIDWANQSRINILSLDIPSGMDGDSWETLAKYIESKWTVTFGLPITGHLNPNFTGQLLLADLGIPPSVFNSMGFHYRSPFSDKFLVTLTLNH